MSKLSNILTTLLLASTWLIFIGAAHGQGNQFQGVELTIEPVAGNVYMVQRPGGEATLVSLLDLKVFFSWIPYSLHYRTGSLQQ